MKKLIVLLCVFLINKDIVAQNINQREKSLCKTWNAEKLLVNGKEDKENYPFKDDQLIIKVNHEFIATDNLYSYTDRGTWAIEDTMKLVFYYDRGEIDEFSIIKITSDELILRLKRDGDEIDVYWSN